jgi:uncharacterized membrane protein
MKEPHRTSRRVALLLVLVLLAVLAVVAYTVVVRTDGVRYSEPTEWCCGAHRNPEARKA